MRIDIKRVYDTPADSDGLRILVDRLWPRGLAKESAKIDRWLKAVAPSTALRQWYQHDVEKWPEFKQRYIAELEDNPQALDELLDTIQQQDGQQQDSQPTITLLYSSKEGRYNNAAALLEYLNTKI